MSTKTIFAPKPPETWLLALRQGTATFEFCKKELFSTLADNGKDLSDIGSSQDEITRLERDNPRKVGISYAKFWLDRMRTTTNKGDFEISLGLFNKEVSKHNITFSELYTNGSEMDKLLVRF